MAISRGGLSQRSSPTSAHANDPGRSPHGRLHEPKDADREPLELVVAPEPREPQEHPREHRVPRGDRRVLEILRPRDARIPVRGSEVEAAVRVVGEELDREPGEAVRLQQPANVAGRDVQLDSPLATFA